MRILSFLVFFTLTTCGSVPQKTPEEVNFYFYFEEVEGKMSSYYNAEKQKKSYTYYPQNAVSILFYVKKDNGKFLQKTINPKDTVGLGVKTYDWLNRFDNIRRDSFLYRKPRKNYFIIEKDSILEKLKLIEVVQIDEIE
ncbi:hypothetical protein J4050_15110 [Winogradskyella sp. DF17]|uniref:Lipoprotein n=1 Tax=Winogradskyella pelagia TaxID=2819984 RepID=A0ABS3T5Q2_9FLAO|nr:hypothetical protein [Winogradskyella sp. DF17]MBO3118080.1 hypothetical protein [Winogradskyella sp. DF17]